MGSGDDDGGIRRGYNRSYRSRSLGALEDLRGVGEKGDLAQALSSPSVRPGTARGVRSGWPSSRSTSPAALQGSSAENYASPSSPRSKHFLRPTSASTSPSTSASTSAFTSNIADMDRAFLQMSEGLSGFPDPRNMQFTNQGKGNSGVPPKSQHQSHIQLQAVATAPLQFNMTSDPYFLSSKPRASSVSRPSSAGSSRGTAGSSRGTVGSGRGTLNSSRGESSVPLSVYANPPYLSAAGISTSSVRSSCVACSPERFDQDLISSEAKKQDKGQRRRRASKSDPLQRRNDRDMFNGIGGDLDRYVERRSRSVDRPVSRVVSLADSSQKIPRSKKPSRTSASIAGREGPERGGGGGGGRKSSRDADYESKKTVNKKNGGGRTGSQSRGARSRDAFGELDSGGYGTNAHFSARIPHRSDKYKAGAAATATAAATASSSSHSASASPQSGSVKSQAPQHGAGAAQLSPSAASRVRCRNSVPISSVRATDSEENLDGKVPARRKPKARSGGDEPSRKASHPVRTLAVATSSPASASPAPHADPAASPLQLAMAAFEGELMHRLNAAVTT